MGRKQTRHNDMVLALSRLIAPGMDRWTELLDLFTNNPLSKREIKETDSMQTLFEKLVDYEEIEVGEYGKVINLLQSNGKKQFNGLVRTMKQCQNDIEVMEEVPSNQLTSDSDSNTGTTMQSDRGSVSSEFTPQNVTADGPSSDKYPTSYLKRETRGKRGLMVIFNFTFKGKDLERPQAPVDKKYLQDFFEAELGWDVEYHEDCDEAEVNTHLKATRTTLKKDKYNNGSFKYYCLFVVVMSHGGEEYFRTKDGKEFKYADVFSEFTNGKIPEFAA